jgi:hypothetical protein
VQLGWRPGSWHAAAAGEGTRCGARTFGCMRRCVGGRTGAWVQNRCLDRDCHSEVVPAWGLGGPHGQSSLLQASGGCNGACAVPEEGWLALCRLPMQCSRASVLAKHCALSATCSCLNWHMTCYHGVSCWCVAAVWRLVHGTIKMSPALETYGLEWYAALVRLIARWVQGSNMAAG